MAKFKVVTVETTTYVHYIEAENEDAAWEEFDDSSEGEEVDHDYEITEVEEVK